MHQSDVTVQKGLSRRCAAHRERVDGEVAAAAAASPSTPKSLRGAEGAEESHPLLKRYSRT